MNTTSFKILEYDLIKDRVKELCVSNLGKTLCDDLTPCSDIQRVRIALQETTEARLMANGGAQPIQALHDISEPMDLVGKGLILAPKDLLRIADTMRGAAKFKRLMRSKKAETPLLSSYAESIAEVPDLIQSIESSVDGERVSDGASDSLAGVRRSMRQIDSKIQQRLQTIMSSAGLKDVVQDGYVTVKNGRYVIPVKASLKARIPGTVVAASSSGQTVFVEPTAVQNLVNELVTLRYKEEELVYKVLCELTGLVLGYLQEIKVTVEAMAACDFALAKGRYSLAIGGVEPAVSPGGPVNLVGVRHPLLGKEAVPVDITVGGRYRTLVITGPNTGGKTVLLKTVGLSSLMAQSGLHIPADRAAMPLFREVLADIGDRQSIQQSLSTFSSHMGNISNLLRIAGPGSLVLLDEVGTGTDPREGAALACGLLEYLHGFGCVTVATTHYGDVKAFSDTRKGFMNGCVEFDEETLKPLYRLQIGKSGKSQGMVVAERLGIPHAVIAKAKLLAAGSAPVRIDLETARGTGIEEEGEAAGGSRSGDASSDDDAATGDTAAAAEGNSASSAAKVFSDIQGREELPRERQFLLGDSVFVGSVKDQGLVAREADEFGDLIVLVRDRRLKVNHKRLKLLIKREDLYPDLPNYDLRIVLASKEDRRLDKAMAKHAIDKVRPIEKDPE